MKKILLFLFINKLRIVLNLNEEFVDLYLRFFLSILKFRLYSLPQFLNGMVFSAKSCLSQSKLQKR